MMAKYCPDKLSTDSFLLNHSPEYQIAAVASWVEFVLELWLFPWMKNMLFLSFTGLLMMVGGEILRKLAMITAESNFTHLIQTRKERGHILVTHGIYSVCRHPGYAGWFWWSIGKKARNNISCLDFSKKNRKCCSVFTQPDVKLMPIRQLKFPWTLIACGLQLYVLTNFHFLPVFALGYVTACINIMIIISPTPLPGYQPSQKKCTCTVRPHKKTQMQNPFI